MSVSLHPTGDYFASASANGSWAFADLSSTRVLASVAAPVDGEAIHAASFHPDGLIFGSGTSTGKVRVWDMKTLGNVASFGDHTAPVRSIAFSENGFYMASASDDHTGNFTWPFLSSPPVVLTIVARFSAAVGS